MVQTLGQQFQVCSIPCQHHLHRTFKIGYPYHLSVLFVVEQFLHSYDKIIFPGLQLPILLPESLDQKSGSSRRSLHPHMCNTVDDCFVSLVTDSGNHRQGKLRNISSHLIRIETAQIGLRTTSPDNDHHIEYRFIFINPFQSGNHRIGRFIPLHNRRKEFDLKTIPVRIGLQLIHKISQSCSRR